MFVGMHFFKEWMTDHLLEFSLWTVKKNCLFVNYEEELLCLSSQLKLLFILPHFCSDQHYHHHHHHHRHYHYFSKPLGSSAASSVSWGRRPPWEQHSWVRFALSAGGLFLVSSHTSDLSCGSSVAALPGTWHYRISAGTGWPCVSILWLGEIESLICLSVAANTIVCCWDGKQPTNKQTNLCCNHHYCLYRVRWRTWPFTRWPLPTPRGQGVTRNSWCPTRSSCTCPQRCLSYTWSTQSTTSRRE